MWKHLGCPRPLSGAFFIPNQLSLEQNQEVVAKTIGPQMLYLQRINKIKKEEYHPKTRPDYIIIPTNKINWVVNLLKYTGQLAQVHGSIGASTWVNLLKYTGLLGQVHRFFFFFNRCSLIERLLNTPSRTYSSQHGRTCTKRNPHRNSLNHLIHLSETLRRKAKALSFHQLKD